MSTLSNHQWGGGIVFFNHYPEPTFKETCGNHCGLFLCKILYCRSTPIRAGAQANLMLGVALQRTSIPSGGGGVGLKVPLNATEARISSGLMGHLA